MSQSSQFFLFALQWIPFLRDHPRDGRYWPNRSTDMKA